MLTAETSRAYANALIARLKSELQRTGVTPTRAAREMGMIYENLLHFLHGRRVPTLHWTVNNIEEYLVTVLEKLPSK